MAKKAEDLLLNLLVYSVLILVVLILLSIPFLIIDLIKFEIHKNFFFDILILMVAWKICVFFAPCFINEKLEMEEDELKRLEMERRKRKVERHGNLYKLKFK